MDSTMLVLAAIALGIIVGIGVTFAIVGARAAGRRRAHDMRPELPEIATSILDQIETFAVILDASLTPVYANPTAKHEQHVSGDRIREPAFLQRVRDVMTSGIPDALEPDPDDPSESIRIHLVRIQRRFVVILAEDLGEEQRVNAMRRDFIANVSHELKTPIAAIGLLAEAVQEAADEPELVRGFAKSLVKESRRLGELSRDVIQLSEAQSTLRPEDREPVRLRDLVRGEVESHREFAMQHGVELVVTDIEKLGQDPVIMGRPTSLGSTIANLLSNAIRHSPEGGRVGVGMALDKQQFLVTVTDQGDGIAPEHLPRIFERFYRVDGARARSAGASGGTGLGLSIARHTMRAHGGDIDVWSQVGVGSSFTLEFPVHDDTGPKKGQQRKIKRARKIVRGAANRRDEQRSGHVPDQEKGS